MRFQISFSHARPSPIQGWPFFYSSSVRCQQSNDNLFFFGPLFLVFSAPSTHSVYRSLFKVNTFYCFQADCLLAHGSNFCLWYRLGGDQSVATFRLLSLSSPFADNQSTDNRLTHIFPFSTFSFLLSFTSVPHLIKPTVYTILFISLDGCLMSIVVERLASRSIGHQ